MRNTRKLICAAMAVALLAVTLLPAFAVSVDWGPTTVHLLSKDGEPYFTDDIAISDLNGAKVTNIKSDKKSVISIASFTTETRSFTNYDDEDDREEEDKAAIGLKARKKGSAVISFKVGSKTYKKTYTVLAYVNPVKSFVVTGINNSNMKSVFAQNAIANGKLSANAKAGDWKVTAANGWKIQKADWLDLKNDDIMFQQFSKGAASISMYIPAMKKTGQYMFRLHLINIKTKAEVNIIYSIR